MRKELQTLILEPGTGKAIELLAGQILRIEQVEGGQCVDFNAFNLQDYKEFMHCGRTRTVHGFNPTEGMFLWSQPPRERAPSRQIPAELADIAMKAMAKRPEDRFQTMEEMIEAIRSFRGRALESAG